MEQTQLDNVVLAMLFASDEPLSPRKISAALDDVSPDEIREAIKRISADFSDANSSIRVEDVAGGVQLATNPEYAKYVARLYSGRRKQRLSKAGMETLAIIAYKQPITRADIENLRGVACGGVLTTLMERSLIRISGKAKVLGAPFLYSTTHEFLEYLGLNTLKDLPSMEQLELLLEQEEQSQVPKDVAVIDDSNATVIGDAEGTAADDPASTETATTNAATSEEAAAATVVDEFESSDAEKAISVSSDVDQGADDELKRTPSDSLEAAAADEDPNTVQVDGQDP